VGIDYLHAYRLYHVASSAVAETREYIAKKYGEDYVPPTLEHSPRCKRCAGSPRSNTTDPRPPEPAEIKTYLNSNQFKLYDLIWKRMVASRWRRLFTIIPRYDIEARSTTRKDYLFRVSAQLISSPDLRSCISNKKTKKEREDSHPAGIGEE